MTPFYVYSLFGFSGLMLFANLFMRILNEKRPLFLFNMLLLAVLVFNTSLLLSAGYSGVFADVFSINPFSLFMSLIFTVALMFVNLIAYGYSDNYMDFAVIGGFSLLGMYAVVSATSLITIFLGLELSTIPVVFAILLSRRGIEAAAKLLIMASIAIAVLSFGIVVFYGQAGGLALSSYSGGALTIFAGLLFIASLGFEASIFPFNVLMPDVYNGSPAYLTGMLGGMNKKVGFAALIQILILIFISDKQLFLLVAVLSVLTMTYGNIVALMQRNTKRMLAYSSISQAGYIMIGIASATPQGITAAMFQIFSHMFIFIGIMAVVAMLEKANRTDIDGMTGLARENGYAAFAMAIFMLSLIGLPFTTGFVGKVLLFLSAINAGLVWLAVIGIINTVISILYYARAIMAMYTDKEGGRQLRMARTAAFAMLGCIFITIFFGLYPQPVIGLLNNASAYLYSVS